MQMQIMQKVTILQVVKIKLLFKLVIIKSPRMQFSYN